MADRMTAGVDEHLKAVDALRAQLPLLRQVSDTIIEAIRNGGTIYILGNGGSAADAQHIAAELLGRFKLDRRALPAVALTTDTSILTAVGNDLGSEFFYERQVDALVRKQDVVWVLSVSGTSPNIIRGVKVVKEKGAKLIGFTGESGGELAPYCDLCLKAAHTSSDRVQEVHELDEVDLAD